MEKKYRIEYETKCNDEINHAYDLISADNDHEARAEFSKRYHRPWFKILAVDELDPETITSRIEGAHLSTIPALQHLPLDSIVVTPVNCPGCEWHWESKVWRDKEGHRLCDKSTGTGCRGYMEDPPQGGPYYFVHTADDYRGIYLCVNLCQKHLEKNFPEWKKAVPEAYKLHVLLQERGTKQSPASRKNGH